MAVMLTSLAVSGTATMLALMIGLPLSSWCSKHQSASLNWLKIMIRALYGLPPVVVGVAVYLALSRKGPFGDLELLFTIEGMIMAQTLLILPLIWGLSWTALDKIPKEVLETHNLLATKNMMMIRFQEARARTNANLCFSPPESVFGDLFLRLSKLTCFNHHTASSASTPAWHIF